MRYTSDRLYSDYTNKKTDNSGIKARLNQRLKWLKLYIKNGSCKRKLIACGVISE